MAERNTEIVMQLLDEERARIAATKDDLDARDKKITGAIAALRLNGAIAQRVGKAVRRHLSPEHIAALQRGRRRALRAAKRNAR